MAIVWVNGTSPTSIKQEIQGETADIKPTLTADNSGSTYFNVTDSSAYLWHINSWRAV